MCGENYLHIPFFLPSKGSPPRVRGKPGNVTENCLIARITPACAGKTEARASAKENIQDHPRVCGENTSEMAYFRG